MDIVKQLLLQLILILLNAFFAATEIAVISLNEKKVRAQAEDGNKKAVKILKIIEEPTRFLSAIQVGITLAGFLGSAFAADNFADRLSTFVMRTWAVSPHMEDTINTCAVILITLILSYFTLVLGELVPKRIAMRHKERLAEAVCGVISVLTVILKPVIWLLTASTNGMLRLFGIDPHAKEEAVSEEDIVIMLDAGADEGTLNEDDIEYIKNVFKLDRLTAADVMTQRSVMVALQEDATDATIVSLLAREGYSRIPVFDAGTNSVVGILHAREYLIGRGQSDFSLSDAMRPPVFVPETMHLDVLFKDMQREHTQMVVVVNEYGHTLGIVTMEDILEELVGEIFDEQDEAVESFTLIEENVWRVRTSISIEEFFEHFALETNEEILSTTVNGWLSEMAGDIPEIGYTFTYKCLHIQVTGAEDVMTHEITVTVFSEENEEMQESTEN